MLCVIVVERCVAPADRFEAVVEIQDDLGKRQFVSEERSIGVDIFCRDVGASTVLSQFHNVADVFGRYQNLRIEHGLRNVLDLLRGGHLRGVVDVDFLAICQENLVLDIRDGRDDLHLELACEPLLDDLHMEEAKETASEPESEGHRRFGFVSQRGIVQVEFLEGGAQFLVVLGIDGIQTGKHHGLDVFVAR